MAAPGFCTIARRKLDDYVGTSRSLWTFTKLAVGKPMQLFASVSPEMRRVFANIVKLSQQQQSAENILRDIHKRNILAGLAGAKKDEVAATRAGLLIDQIPSHVLAGLGLNGGKDTLRRITFAELKARTYDYLQKFNARYYGATTEFKPARFYDKRYLNPDKIKWAEVEEAFNALNPNQLQAVADTADAWRKLRAQTLLAKRASSSYDIFIKTNRLIMEGKIPSVTPVEAIKHTHNLIIEECGPTVTSYASHVIHDTFGTTDTAYMLQKLVGKDNLRPLTDKLEQIMFEMPDASARYKLTDTTSRADWVATKLREWFKSPEGGSLDPAIVDKEITRDTGMDLINLILGSNANKRITDVLGTIPRKIFAPYIRHRFQKSVELGAGVFDEFPTYTSVMMRKAYMEPAHAYGMANKSLLTLYPDKQKAFQIWLDASFGVPPNTGLRRLLNDTAGARTALSSVESGLIKLVYYKMLWANTSSSFLNSMQTLNFGFGKNGMMHFAGGVRLLLADDAFFTNRLLDLGATSNGLSSTMTGHVGTGMNFIKNLKNELAPVYEMIQRAQSPQEVWKIYKSLGIRALHAFGDLMGQVETFNRLLTGSAAMHESAVLQLLEANPGAKLLKRGNGLVVVLKSGAELDPVVELRKSFAAFHDLKGNPTHYPVFATEPPNSELMREALNKGVGISWRRVEEDAVMKNMDVNFALSPINYSTLERAIRSFPVIGPASGVFMNYTTQFAGRLAFDISKVAKFATQKTAGSIGLGGLFRSEVTAGEAGIALKRLVRVAVGTYLIAGPYAFRPAIDASLRIAHMFDSSLPESTDDPHVKAVLDSLEQYTISGIFGLDLSEKIGINIAQIPQFLTGNRFANNPLTDMVTSAFGLKGKSEEEQAKAQYGFFGKFAAFLYPDRGPQGFGHDPIGKQFPLLPIGIYNIIKTCVDLYDEAHIGHTVDDLGREADAGIPAGLLIKRGILGRTIYDREKMRALSETRPELSSKLTTLRQAYVAAIMSHDYARAKEVNKTYTENVPIKGLDAEHYVHPDLRMTNADAQRYFFAHATTAEFRQLRFGTRGMVRIELERALAGLAERGMLLPNGAPDIRKIEASDDPRTIRLYRVVVAVLGRNNGRNDFAGYGPRQAPATPRR